MEIDKTFEDFLNASGRDVIDIAYQLLDNSMDRSHLATLYDDLNEESHFKNYICGLYYDNMEQRPKIQPPAPRPPPKVETPLSPRESASPRPSNRSGRGPTSPHGRTGRPRNNPYDLLAQFINRKPEPTVDEVIRLLEQYQIIDLNGYDSNGNTPLVTAIMNGREDLVEIFIKRKADVNRPTKNDNSLLYISLQCHVCIRSRMFKLLLAKGANPELPALFREGQPITISDQSLSTELSETMKYWLGRAKKVKIYQPKIRVDFEEVESLGLTEAYFALVGQEIATESIVETIFAKKADPDRENKPVCLFLVGAPGHGKSEMAKNIANCLAPSDNIIINCGTIGDSKWALFGSDVGYIGSDKGTELANFVGSHNGKFGVVVLEEFEKAGSDAREALLHPFESGEWSNKKSHTKPFNCSKIIFIMTSNLINSEITRMLESNGLIVQFMNETDVMKKKTIRKGILNKVETMVKQELKQIRPQEFARRVTVIPFISLNDIEQKIILLEMEDKLISRYVKPPVGTRKIGNILIHFTKKFTETIIKKYDPMQGASSLKSPLEEEINRSVLEIKRQEEPPKEVWFFLNKYDTPDFNFTGPEEEKEEVPPVHNIFGSFPDEEFEPEDENFSESWEK